MASTPMILIVGGDSMIGHAILAEAASKGIPCTSTSRRPGAEFFLDLTAPSDTWQLPANVQTAILCASFTGIANCENSPEETRRVNVEATIQLSNRLASQGVRIVFLSSSQVFGPTAQCPDENTPTSPISEYGRQKAEVEKYLLSQILSSKIVRLTKVIYFKNLLFKKWLMDLSMGNTITAYRNYYFAPIALTVAAQRVLSIASSQYLGVFHLSTIDTISYYNAAKWFAERIGYNAKLVKSAPLPIDSIKGPFLIASRKTENLLKINKLNAIDQLELEFANSF